MDAGRQIIPNPRRRLKTSLAKEPPYLAPLGNSLARGLDRLDRILEEL